MAPPAAMKRAMQALAELPMGSLTSSAAGCYRHSGKRPWKPGSGSNGTESWISRLSKWAFLGRERSVRC